jgi:hypothetical protein
VFEGALAICVSFAAMSAPSARSLAAVLASPYNLCKNITWKLDIYEADGYYIKECYDNNKDKHVYIDADLCYYNFLQAF